MLNLASWGSPPPPKKKEKKKNFNYLRYNSKGEIEPFMV